MDRLVDYIKWMGDVPFRGLPLNEADALVLCMLSYYDFSPLFQGRTKRLPLRGAFFGKRTRKITGETGCIVYHRI